MDKNAMKNITLCLALLMLVGCSHDSPPDKTSTASDAKQTPQPKTPPLTPEMQRAADIVKIDAHYALYRKKIDDMEHIYVAFKKVSNKNNNFKTYHADNVAMQQIDELDTGLQPPTVSNPKANIELTTISAELHNILADTKKMYDISKNVHNNNRYSPADHEEINQLTHDRNQSGDKIKDSLTRLYSLYGIKVDKAHPRYKQADYKG